MEPAGLADLFEFLAQPAHALADHAAVGLDLRFAGATKEPETAALAFEVGPAAHQAALLVIEMGKFDLQAAFRRRGTLAEDLEDQPCAVDDLAFELVLEVALLDRGQRAVHHDKFRFVLLAGDADIVDLARAEQEVWPHFAHGEDEALRNHDTDGEGESLRLGEARLGIEVVGDPADIRAYDERPRTAGHFTHQIIVETQLSSSSQSSVRSTGVAGWMVDTACLYASWTYPSRSSSMQKRS